MPQKEIQVTNWVKDPVTGYLTSLDPRHKFTSQVKAEFIKKLLERRDVEEACGAVKISRRILTAHLRADPHFKAAYNQTITLIKDPERLKKLEVVERLWTKTQS